MNGKVVFNNEFIEITLEGSDFYIQSFKLGFSLEGFNKIIAQNPQIKILSFTTIKSAILFAPRDKEKFGEMKDRVIIDVLQDSLKAYFSLNISPEELQIYKREALKKEIFEELEKAGVIFGIKGDVFLEELVNEKKYLVAEGLAPKNGIDSVVKLYEIKEAKPKISEDQSVDHYDLSLINHVAKDEWLGERKEATLGTPGKNVKGITIPAVPGKTILLDYDKNSVYEETNGDVITIRAIFSGAVSYINGQIMVSNHLEVPENVDFSTGNIDFDGCVTIKGTIHDNFMVQADGDIEIQGDLGVGNIRGIVSRSGSIYIKGGISCKNMVEIRAAKNVFVKYASNVRIIAGQAIHIGYYCINTEANARVVLVDSSKGQIIGGIIVAEAKIVANTLGSPSEKRTFLRVKGINKEMIWNQMEDLVSDINKQKTELAILKNDLNIANEMKESQGKISMIKNKISKLSLTIKGMEEERRTLGDIFKVKGDGEVTILKKAYANCSIEIRNQIIEITYERPGVTFYLSDNEIKEAT